MRKWHRKCKTKKLPPRCPVHKIIPTGTSQHEEDSGDRDMEQTGTDVTPEGHKPRGLLARSFTGCVNVGSPIIRVRCHLIQQGR